MGKTSTREERLASPVLKNSYHLSLRSNHRGPVAIEALMEEESTSKTTCQENNVRGCGEAFSLGFNYYYITSVCFSYIRPRVQ